MGRWHTIRGGEGRSFVVWSNPAIVGVLVFAGGLLLLEVFFSSVGAGRRIVERKRMGVEASGFCWRCGYNIEDQRVCPECGTARRFGPPAER